MRRFQLNLSTLLTLLAIVLPVPAAADPISVTARVVHGEILLETVGSVQGRIDLTGTRSIKVDAFFDSGDTGARCEPCVSGETISLSSSIVAPFAGTVRYRGDEFVLRGSNSGGALQLIAPSFVLPPSETGSVSFQFPFTLEAESFGSFFTDKDPRISVTLTGSGQVTGTFNVFRQPLGSEFSGSDFYTLDSLRYDFGAAPVPEPATMTLLGIGLAAGCAARRRNRRQDR